MTKLQKALGADLASIAELLRSKGRGKDTVLAHITPKEAALLKKRGGSGTKNPDTGLLEFEDSGSYDFTPPDPVSPTYDVVNQNNTFTPTQSDTGVPVDVGKSYAPGDGSFAPSVSPIGNAGTELLNSYGQTTPYSFNGANPATQTGPATSTISPSNDSSLNGVTTPQAASGATGASKSTDPSWLDKAGKAVTDPGNLAKLALAGGLGLFGASKARTAGNQINSAVQQQQDLANPFQSQGTQLISQAQAGNLNPQSQQAYQAAKAKLNQEQANRGGVGGQQTANSLANIYQGLLNNQYTYGLQVLQIGDNYAVGAIKTGLQLDQTLNTATTNFYTNLASILAGGGGGFGGNATRTV